MLLKNKGVSCYLRLEISLAIAKAGARRAGLIVGTPSAAKSLGRIPSHVVGDFAHRSVPWSALEILTR